MDFRPDWIEAQLHHAIKNSTQAAYKRTAFLDQRKGMMQRWADYRSRAVRPHRQRGAGRSLPQDDPRIVRADEYREMLETSL
jgi:hypothetical protein